MEKKFKRVPFDLELAKDIQHGRVEGRIVTNIYKNELCNVRIICWDRKDIMLPLIGLYETYNHEEGCVFFNEKGLDPYYDGEVVYIELPEEALIKEQISAIFDEDYYQSSKDSIEQVYLDMADEYTGLLCNSCDWKGADAQKVLALWIKLNMPKKRACKGRRAKNATTWKSLKLGNVLKKKFGC